MAKPFNWKASSGWGLGGFIAFSGIVILTGGTALVAVGAGVLASVILGGFAGLIVEKNKKIEIIDDNTVFLPENSNLWNGVGESKDINTKKQAKKQAKEEFQSLVSKSILDNKKLIEPIVPSNNSKVRIT